MCLGLTRIYTISICRVRGLTRYLQQPLHPLSRGCLFTSCHRFCVVLFYMLTIPIHYMYTIYLSISIYIYIYTYIHYRRRFVYL